MGFTILKAQVIFNDSLSVYNYWGKRGIIEMVYAYMNDYAETVTGVKISTIESDGIKKFNEKLIQNIEAKTTEEINSDFDNVSELLIKNDWQNAEKRLFIPLKGRLISSKKLDKSFFEVTKPGSKEKSTDISGFKNLLKYWNKTEDQVIKEYNSDLRKITQKVESEKSLPETVQNNQDTFRTRHIDNNKYDANTRTRVHKKLNWLNFFFCLIAMASSFIFGGLVVYLISKSEIYSILSQEKDNYLSEIRRSKKRFPFVFLHLVEKLKERKDDYKRKSENSNKKDNYREILNLNEQIAGLKEIKDALQKENLLLKENFPKQPTEDVIDNKVEISQKANGFSIIYFTIPEDDGSFIVDKGGTYDDGRKFYKIEYSKDDVHGKLFFITSDQDKKAINRLDSYLKPVCEIENILLGNSANKIELSMPGTVVLIEDRWVIYSEKKVKIKLL